MLPQLPSTNPTAECLARLQQWLQAWCRTQQLAPPDDVQAEANLVEAARREEISALLYLVLPRPLQSLYPDYRSCLAGNLLYLRELERLVSALRQAGVRFVVVKGAALATTVYPHLGMRSLEDIDLLVHRDDANLLRLVMNHLGWQEEDSDIAGSQFGWRYRGEMAFRRTAGDLLLRVEAHLDVPGFYPRRRDTVWSRVQWISVEGFGEMPLLHTTTHLCYLCAHLYYHHQGRGVKWLVDIALLYSQIDSWSGLLGEAYHFGVTRPLRLALEEVARHFGIAIPAHMLKALEVLPMPLGLRILLELCRRPRWHYLGIRLLDLYRAPSWSVRVGYLWRKLTAPRWRNKRCQA